MRLLGLGRGRDRPVLLELFVDLLPDMGVALWCVLGVHEIPELDRVVARLCQPVDKGVIVVQQLFAGLIDLLCGLSDHQLCSQVYIHLLWEVPLNVFADNLLGLLDPVHRVLYVALGSLAVQLVRQEEAGLLE